MTAVPSLAPFSLSHSSLSHGSRASSALGRAAQRAGGRWASGDRAGDGRRGAWAGELGLAWAARRTGGRARLGLGSAGVSRPAMDEQGGAEAHLRPPWRAFLSLKSMVAGTDGVSPNAHVLFAAAKASAVLHDRCAGTCIHGSVVVRGYGDDGVVLSALVDMYGHAAAPGDARKAFEELRAPDGMRGCREVVVESSLVDLYASYRFVQ
ncbi:uncharacterized protein LOC133896938 [Phragmites australis]|uniref:uncharacterized protein LOC133896938 n=1 Tax=Phragmites australis TaxID=29695 RepID=UPI002D77071E|nr:uncharacterized protein LOC133896938 [Phragmites australis]